METLLLPVAPSLPTPHLPTPLSLDTPLLELPRADIPAYTPLYIPPAGTAGDPDTLLPNVKKNSEEPTKEAEGLTPESIRGLIQQALQQQPKPQVPKLVFPQPSVEPSSSAEVTTITLPGTNLNVPVPKAEILSAAATTSVISVGATLAATSMFKRLVQIFKPAFKAAAAKVQKLRGKKVETFGRRRWRLRRSKADKIVTRVVSCNPSSAARRT